MDIFQRTYLCLEELYGISASPPKIYLDKNRLASSFIIDKKEGPVILLQDHPEQKELRYFSYVFKNSDFIDYTKVSQNERKIIDFLHECSHYFQYLKYGRTDEKETLQLELECIGSLIGSPNFMKYDKKYLIWFWRIEKNIIKYLRKYKTSQIFIDEFIKEFKIKKFEIEACIAVLNERQENNRMIYEHDRNIVESLTLYLK